MAVCSVCQKDTYRYRVSPEDGSIRCLKTCVTASRQGRRLSTFPFTTSNMFDQPGEITVNSLAHLRKLERAAGVQSVAYNFDRPESYHPPSQDIPGPARVRR
jgi:hypothetical protein